MKDNPQNYKPGIELSRVITKTKNTKTYVHAEHDDETSLSVTGMGKKGAFLYHDNHVCDLDVFYLAWFVRKLIQGVLLKDCI